MPNSNYYKSLDSVGSKLWEYFEAHIGKQVYFVSLGPYCQSASLLKYSGMRRFSLPFDWGQSGSTVLQEFFEHEPEIFYARVILNPTIHLIQHQLPSSANDFVSHLRQRTLLYGWPYFFNPHRSLGLASKVYFIRCKERLKNLVSDSSKHLVFLLSDQVSSDALCYFNSFATISEWLCKLFRTHCYCSWSILLARTDFSPNLINLPAMVVEYSSRYHTLLFHLPNMGYLDDSRFDYTMCCSAKLIHSYLRSGIYELPILQSDKPERSVKKQSSFYAKVIQLYTSVYCMGLLPKHISPPSDPNIEHWEYYDELSKISGGEI